MQPGLSVYLDLVRYCAALVVFVGHASGRPWTGGLFWQVGPYGQTAVMIFFVLSGFVIAYVAQTREQQATEYAATRLARLWSVVLPALALTFVVDQVGLRVAPELYIGKPWYQGDDPWSRYLTSTFFVHDFWDAGLVPGINAPFWSISYEAAYYLLFGIALFIKQRAISWLVLATAAALAGPTIVAMFPLWLLGVAAYRLTQRERIPPAWGWPLFIASLAVLAAAPKWRAATAHISLPSVHRGAIVADYVDGIAFFVNIIAAHAIGNTIGPLLLRWKRPIVWLASTSFALYLFHRPLLQLFTYLGPTPADGWPRRVLIFIGIPLVVALLTPPTETLKRRLKRGLTRALSWRFGRASQVPANSTSTCPTKLQP